jgi:hypothetical protein
MIQGIVTKVDGQTVTIRQPDGVEVEVRMRPRSGPQLVVVADAEDPRWREVETHAMLHMGVGTWYHVRLNTVFVIKADLGARGNGLPVTGH